MYISLVMKKLVPVRLLKNPFYQQVAMAEAKGASIDELKELLGRARAKKGMFEGDLENGELEIGQVSCIVKDLLPATDIMQGFKNEFARAVAEPFINR